MHAGIKYFLPFVQAATWLIIHDIKFSFKLTLHFRVIGLKVGAQSKILQFTVSVVNVVVFHDIKFFFQTFNLSVKRRPVIPVYVFSIPANVCLTVALYTTPFFLSRCIVVYSHTRGEKNLKSNSLYKAKKVFPFIGLIILKTTSLISWFERKNQVWKLSIGNRVIGIKYYIW